MKTNCPDCGSSDGLHVYEDHTHCYVCKKQTWNNQVSKSNGTTTYPSTTRVSEVNSYRSFPIGSRGITQEVVDHFGVKMSVDPDGKPESHFYPFTKDGETVAWKERKLPKEFRTHGDFAGAELFGQNVASGKLLVVTEGELDAMAVAQAWHTKYNRFYAVVSLPNGVNSVKSLLINRDFIRSFETVVLMFDQDEVGKAAVDEAAKIVGMGRCKVAKLPAKDPCDVLKEFGADTLVKAVYNAQTWSPAGIVMGEAIWDQFMARKNTESLPYPDCLGGLNEKLGGIRAGEITLFTSGTGSGKSTVIKEIILDLLSKTDDKIGLISLEESVGDTAEKFISMSLGRATNGHPPLTDDELRRGFDSVFGDERLVLLDHQGSVSDASLIDKIEYLALMGCKYLVLDHITIAVSEGTDGLSGNEAIDKMMSDLLKIVKQHNVWLGLISHLRKSMHGKSFEEGHLASIDDIKGSGSIKQISFDIIAFARNLVAENEHERNQIKLRVLKSRFTGRTGDAGTAVYDPDTTRLSAGGGFEYKA